MNCFNCFLHLITSKMKQNKTLKLKMYFVGTAKHNRSGIILFTHYCKVLLKQFIYAAVELMYMR